MKEQDKQLRQEIGWALQRQLAWIGIILGSFVGLIELLNVIRHFSSVTTFVYYFITVTIIYSMENISIEVEKLVRKAKKLGIDEKWSFLEDIFINKCKCPPERRKILLYFCYVFIFFLSTAILIEKLTCKPIWNFINCLLNSWIWV